MFDPATDVPSAIATAIASAFSDDDVFLHFVILLVYTPLADYLLPILWR